MLSSCCLTKLKSIGQGFQLEEKAADAWLRLAAEATAAGHEIHISTAWRSSEHQKKLFARYVKDVAAWKRGGEKGPKPPPVAVPGKSRHEVGLAIDVRVAKYPELLKWLRANASRFGFYEAVKTEPWHWEFRP